MNKYADEDKQMFLRGRSKRLWYRKPNRQNGRRY